MTVFIGGNINELFICNIDDVEIPLGFELYADAFGLNVSYEVSADDASTALSLTNSSGFRATSSNYDSGNDQPVSMTSGNSSLPRKSRFRDL